MQGTCSYLALQIWSMNKYKKESDVYAFAALVYELMNDSFIFNSYNNDQIANYVAYKKVQER